MFESVSFRTTDGLTLRGRYYRVKSANPGPLVIVTGGISSVVDMEMWRFPEAFRKAGLSALIYDHRNFGCSDVQVPLEVEPFLQASDLRDAITFAQTLDGVDPRKIGLWGSSFSGGHVIWVGATDRRVQCVVAQVPFLSGSATVARQLTPEQLGMARQGFAADRLARMAGAKPQMIAVVTDDPAVPAVLATRESFEWTERFKATSKTWANQITLRSLELGSAYEPGAYIEKIAPTPFLMIVGTEDTITTPDVALDYYARAREPKELVLIKTTHFGPYDSHFEAAVRPASEFFLRHLG